MMTSIISDAAPWILGDACNPNAGSSSKDHEIQAVLMRYFPVVGSNLASFRTVDGDTAQMTSRSSTTVADGTIVKTLRLCVHSVQSVTSSMPQFRKESKGN